MILLIRNNVCSTTNYLGRICKNTTKLVGVMDNFDESFIEDSSVFNVVSKAVLPENVADEVLNHQKIGDSMYKEFINERFKGEISVWSPLKKRNRKTFTSQGKTLKSKVEVKVIQLKEESLFSRFLITCKRPELDLEHCLGNFEFSVVPKALFSTDGEPLLCTDKAKLLQHIEELGKLHQQNDTENVDENEMKVLAIDGMAVLN